VEATMLRNPCSTENPYKFFAGYNEEGNAYLFLPTAKGLLKSNYLFALAIIRNEEKKYIYELDTKVVPISLDDIYDFHEDLTFFFGPNHNMLKKFLESKGYKTYINWIHKKREKQIDTLLAQFGQADTPSKREQLTEKLRRFIEA
jgi:hypothetical protein